MKLIEAVKAYLAAEELNKESLPYDLALAIVLVKRALKEHIMFYVEKESCLIREYAELDENGAIRITADKRFIFKDPALSGEYERRHKSLDDTEIGLEQKPFLVLPPKEIKPCLIEDLSGWIEFTTEG